MSLIFKTSKRFLAGCSVQTHVKVEDRSSLLWLFFSCMQSFKYHIYTGISFIFILCYKFLLLCLKLGFRSPPAAITLREKEQFSITATEVRALIIYYSGQTILHFLLIFFLPYLSLSYPQLLNAVTLSSAVSCISLDCHSSTLRERNFLKPQPKRLTY